MVLVVPEHNQIQAALHDKTQAHNSQIHTGKSGASGAASQALKYYWEYPYLKKKMWHL